MSIIKEVRIPEWEVRISQILDSKFNYKNTNVLCVEESSSTMDLARQFVMTLANNATEGFVVSKKQTAGRGRQGANWIQAKEALYFTSFFKMTGSEKFINSLPLVAGLSVLDVCSKQGSEAFLKWPNDIFNKDKKKLGGILTEKVDYAGESYLLVGIGVNFYFDEIPLKTASALFDDEKGDDFLLSFASNLFYSLLLKWHQFSLRGFKTFIEDWKNACCHLNLKVRIERADDTIEGICLGVDNDGSLLVEVKDEICNIYSGSLFLSE